MTKGIEVIENNVKNVDFTKEENEQLMKLHEEDFIQGLIAAADFGEEEHQEIEIARDGKVFFKFTIRPLQSEEYEKCRTKATKYVRNKQLGLKLPEETNRVKFQSYLIYQATVKEDREKLWDNKKVWEALRNKDMQILTGSDVIEYTLKAGEKDKVIEFIDTLSGYDNNIEELAKN